MTRFLQALAVRGYAAAAQQIKLVSTACGDNVAADSVLDSVVCIVYFAVYLVAADQRRMIGC